MLKLSGKITPVHVSVQQRSLLIVTTNASLPGAIRGKYALVTSQPPTSIDGFGAVLIRSQNGGKLGGNIYELSTEFDYVKDGDILWIDSVREVLQVLFRKGTPHNSILLTERCNHYCLMCSQPPRDIEDSYLLERAFDLVALLPKDIERLGFTGGEPTLYSSRLIDLISHTKIQLPDTYIDVLSNGRRFKDKEFAKELAQINHPTCTICIPIYSDDPVRHDYVVQARGAFDETIQGILNLKRFAQKVEIRIVLHKQTIERLVSTCEFICRNLLFVDHVALMGLEITGFTRPNLDLLWIDPYDYKDILSEAVGVLNAYGINASVYNHQLCVVNPDIRKNYRRSISDWKNELIEVCEPCAKKGECGGFFSSSKMYRHSEYIKPFVQ